MLFRSNDTATTEIYTQQDTLSLHDALPISGQAHLEAAQFIAPEHVHRHPFAGPVLRQQHVQAGRRIEAHAGCPQDIEWCLAGGELHVLQSRPITTLFPVPEAGDGAPHVYVSVGHQQMMTDAMKPLGLSLFQLTAGRPMYEAAGRLFVDVAALLASPATRDGFVAMIGRSDPLIGDALRTIVERGDLLPTAAAGEIGRAHV